MCITQIKKKNVHLTDLHNSEEDHKQWGRFDFLNDREIIKLVEKQNLSFKKTNSYHVIVKQQLNELTVTWVISCELALFLIIRHIAVIVDYHHFILSSGRQPLS